MQKFLVYGIVVLALVFIGWYVYPGEESGTPPLNADLYPLYQGASWGDVQAKSTADGPAYEVVSTPFTDIANLAEKFLPFTAHYENVLTKAGWVRDDSRAAGGPGAEITYYTKGDQFIIVSFRSDFKVKHPDAPSECPCDLRFSLVSGTQTGPTPAQIEALHVYEDTALGFRLRLPTEISSTGNDLLYRVDTAYEYTARGPGAAIAGVKFTIPPSMAAGTNLSRDSYISVEQLPPGESCDAAAFMADPSAKSRRVTEGAVSYSVASSADAAVGNRYEETVYARADSSPCIAVRYFIHYAAIENFPEGSVKQFDKAALLQEFDQIRRTLALKK